MFALCSVGLSKKILNIGEKNIETYALPTEGYSVHVTHSIKSIQKIWDALAPKHNLFLQSDYLNALEDFPPAKMSFNYLIFYFNQKPIGIGYTQNFKVKVEESINQKEEPKKSGCMLKGIVSAFKNWLTKRVEFNILIAGNLLLTGEYGHYFPGMKEEQAIEVMREGVSLLHKKLEKEGSKIQLLLFKDFLIQSKSTTQDLVANAYHKFKIQPCMYLPLPSEWKTEEDYLSAMSSKYRVRARRAAKKGKNIIKKELTLDDIAVNQERIFELYKSVADNAGFNAFLLHKDYFWALKKYLGDRYKLIAYYLDGKLVAFYTAIFSGDEMEAHFLGVDEAFNRPNQIYLNILYDLVRMGIYHQVKLVDFARTALEIKSSVGAIPRDMHCFIKHRSSFSSTVIKLLFKYLNPEEKWEQRRPFKDKSLLEAQVQINS
ncbi:MAG: GNAT family N-acetyltransferase [Saprospiraceae bacterium]|nr:GNAT family N-acetyltransferase [Saprospiraceae bacterium]